MIEKKQEALGPLAHLEKRVGFVDGVFGVFFRDCPDVRRLVARLRTPQHFRDPIAPTNWIVFDGDPLAAYLATEDQIVFAEKHDKSGGSE